MTGPHRDAPDLTNIVGELLLKSPAQAPSPEINTRPRKGKHVPVAA